MKATYTKLTSKSTGVHTAQTENMSLGQYVMVSMPKAVREMKGFKQVTVLQKYGQQPESVQIYL